MMMIPELFFGGLCFCFCRMLIVLVACLPGCSLSVCLCWHGLSSMGLLLHHHVCVCVQEFFHALSLVRSRTFSGPYVASTLPDRLRLAGLVGVLVVINTAVGGDLSNGLGAAAAVFLFNVIYELLLSNKLKQYAMCPVIDLINHSSYNTVSLFRKTRLEGKREGVLCVERCFVRFFGVASLRVHLSLHIHTLTPLPALPCLNPTSPLP